MKKYSLIVIAVLLPLVMSSLTACASLNTAKQPHIKQDVTELYNPSLSENLTIPPSPTNSPELTTAPSDPTNSTETPTQDSTYHQPDDPVTELPDPDVYLYYDSFDALFANLKDDAVTMVGAGNPFFNTITTDNSFWQTVQDIPAFEKHLIDEVRYVYVDNFAPRRQGFQQLRLRLHPIENCGNSPFHTSCVSYIIITYDPNEGFPSIYTELPYYSKISREPETYVCKFDSGNLTYAFKFTDTLYVQLFIDNYNESIEPLEDAMLEYVRQLYNVAPDHFK